jgi:hypothetical protein
MRAADVQRKLAVLRDQARAVSFAQMRAGLETDLRARWLLAEFDEQPVAAASTGQVYRARLTDGRAVAVKVQYPGIATAVRAYLPRARPATFPTLQGGLGHGSTGRRDPAAAARRRVAFIDFRHVTFVRDAVGW